MAISEIVQMTCSHTNRVNFTPLGHESSHDEDHQEPKRGPELFHYTSFTALKAILKTNSLWATKATHLNDSSEMETIWPRVRRHTVEYFGKEVEKYARRERQLTESKNTRGGLAKVAKSEGEEIVGWMRSRLLASDSTSSITPPFIVSFTTHNGQSDQDKYHREHGMLSQWRGYARTEGIAVVFDKNKLQKLLKEECKRFDHWPCLLSDVAYDFENLEFEDHFPRLSETLKVWTRNFIEPVDDVDIRTLENKVVEELPDVVGRIKHPAFHEERECRIVIGVNSKSLLVELDSTTKLESGSFKQVHYRPGSVGLIPYIRLFEDSTQRLPINRIIVGPSRDQTGLEKKVHELVSAREITVHTSQTPYVGSS